MIERLEHELGLIAELGYAKYFLTVHDIVQFACSQGILCQGRGAAANSTVCYCLGITNVDPMEVDLLFERFISRERNEPPDIDVDFEHERREEVIQHIYRRFGRDRAALTAEVITYRGRSAMREVGKVLGISLDLVDALAKNLNVWSDGRIQDKRLRELGLDPANETLRLCVALVGELAGFPRHLSQHVGGFVITQGPLDELVPIENAAMPDRTVIEWDKDDIDEMGMLKVDCLGLGMLTCLRRALEFVNESWEAAERRSDEATKGGEEVTEGGDGDINCHGQNFSRFDRLAAWDGVGEDCVRRNPADAGRRAVRAHGTDEASGGFDPVEHRRGAWAEEPGRLPQAPAHRARLSGRVVNAVRAGDRPGDAGRTWRAAGAAERNRPGAPRPHQKSGAESRLSQDPTALRRSVAPSPRRLKLRTIPFGDPRVYDMICRADTIGVFQIESRAQMSMLPRLRPRCYYDLVIEVAIVRPGPIQGNMVHPYLRRRNGEEEVSYPTPEIKEVLERTKGVPLFQEQAMRLAVVAAGFTPGEADELRRAMASWRRKGKIVERFGHRIIAGMRAQGYPPEFAEATFNQIKGFGEYGFPESHAASFALLVYASCWLKRHHPAAFAAALINSQPMGFYAPAQIIRDAREHGVEVRPIDVNASGWECGLEESDGAAARRSDGGGQAGQDAPETWGVGGPAIRLGMRLVKGLAHEDADAISGAVADHGAFGTVAELWRASGVNTRALRALASADAFGSMGLRRREALWMIRDLKDERLPLFDGVGTDEAAARRRDEEETVLPRMGADEAVLHDYRVTGLSLRAHPVSFLRERLEEAGVRPCAELRDGRRWMHGKRIRVGGIVLMRQRPGTASGILFMTLEDETGIANLILRPHIYERDRMIARGKIALIAEGRVERQGEVVHVLVSRLHAVDDIAQDIQDLPDRSRSFR